MVALPLTRVPFSCPAQFVKCGFAGDNIPKHVFPSMIGRPMLRAEEGVIGEGDNLSVRLGAAVFPPVFLRPMDQYRVHCCVPRRCMYLSCFAWWWCVDRT